MLKKAYQRKNFGPKMEWKNDLWIDDIDDVSALQFKNKS